MNPPYYSPPQDAYAPPPLQNYSSSYDPHDQHPPPLHLNIPPPLSHSPDASYTPGGHTASSSALPQMQTPQRGRRRKADAQTPGMTPQQASSMTPIVPNPNFKPVRDVNIKTKFPVARIKRIMQADEDVGKVAQVTPVIVSKALELFMISLCDKATEQARLRSSKRITAAHLKRAIAVEEKFDFLAEIISKVPDASAETVKDAGDGEEGAEEAAPKRRKTGGRGRKKEES